MYIYIPTNFRLSGTTPLNSAINGSLYIMMLGAIHTDSFAFYVRCGEFVFFYPIFWENKTIFVYKIYVVVYIQHRISTIYIH